MGVIFSNPKESPSPPIPETNEIVITGLATEWPSKLVTPNDLKQFAQSVYPADAPWFVGLQTIQVLKFFHYTNDCF